MIVAHASIGLFGPFDDDFDPFEDEEELTVLIPLERTSSGITVRARR